MKRRLSKKKFHVFLSKIFFSYFDYLAVGYVDQTDHVIDLLLLPAIIEPCAPQLLASFQFKLIVQF